MPRFLRLRAEALAVARVACVALVSHACIAPAPCGQAGCFAQDAGVRVQVGFDADALAHVDLDGDGHRELVGVSAAAGSLTVLWGAADGFEVVLQTWSIGQEAVGVAIADLDGDGRLDVATALPQADAVAVLRGRVGRGFAAVEQHAAGAIPRALVAVDLDGDGAPELVTANAGDGTVSVLRRLVTDPPIVVGADPRGLAAGDVDGDGSIDVAVALAGDDVVQVMRGDGRGGLAPAQRHAV